MFNKATTIVLFLVLVAIFVLLRVFANFGGAAGFAFNIATAIAIIFAASYVWQRSELNANVRR